MKAGRVPVILSDDWVPPEGPAWESFSLIVPEREVARVPEILESHEHAAAEMGRRAREQWEQWFSASASFHRIVEWCLSIQRSRRMPERLMRRWCGGSWRGRSIFVTSSSPLCAGGTARGDVLHHDQRVGDHSREGREEHPPEIA